LINKPLLSVFIPAYNTPDYTRKTLQSVVDQNYRPIELVVSDDCSPVSLEPLVREFRCYESADFVIRFFRQKSNLRFIDNTIFCFNQCSGKYIVNLQHDDWWTDSFFLSETVDLMEKNPDCYFCVANSEIENSAGKLMIQIPQNLDAKNKWQIIKGEEYIKLLGSSKVGFPAFSAVVFNRIVGLTLGVYNSPFIISNKEGNILGVSPDEFFAFQFLLASIGNVAVTEKIVSVRGCPKTRFSLSSEFSRTLGQAGFVVFYNIYKANLKGAYAKAVKRRAKEMIFYYHIEKINFKILKKFNWSLSAIWFMTLSFIKHLSCVPIYHLSNLYRKVAKIKK